MKKTHTPISKPWLVWVYPHQALNKFNIAPRLEITKEMRNLGWRVDFIAAGPKGQHTVQGVEVLLYPTWDVYFLRHLVFHLYILFYILRFWREIHVVMFHQISALWLLPLRFLYIFGDKHPLLVLDSRTVTMEDKVNATTREKLRKLFYTMMNKLANRFADGQTAITQNMADLLYVPKEKLWGTWPSGVNLDEFSPATTEHQWPQEDKDSVTIIYIGSMHYGRNLLTLCKSVYEANCQGMNFELILYGDGTEKKDLQSFADRAGNCIRIHNVVPHDQIPGILAGAHVGVLPFPSEDKYNASSPIKLFEYMGSGMPILATRIPCHTNVIGNGSYVFWADDSSLTGLLTAFKDVWRLRFALASMGELAFTAAHSWTYRASARRLNLALCHGLSLSGKPGFTDEGFVRS